MKQILLILIISTNTSITLASSDWDTMIWNHDNWYKNQITVTGQVITNVTGKKSGILDAKISIIELGMHVQSDDNGEFRFIDVPDGTYTIQIETEYFAPMQLQEVTIYEGLTSLSEIVLFDQKNRFTQTEVNALLHEERMKYDIDNDGKIGLKEAIKALSISAGFIE